MPRFHNFKLFLAFVLFTCMWILLLVGSVYGIFAEEILIKFRTKYPQNLIFTGTPKLLLSMSGLAISSSMLYVVIKAIIVKSWRFHNRVSLRNDTIIKKYLVPIMALSFTCAVFVSIWQMAINPVYK